MCQTAHQSRKLRGGQPAQRKAPLCGFRLLAVFFSPLALVAGHAAAAPASKGPSSLCERLIRFNEASTPNVLLAALKRSRLDVHSTPILGPFDKPDTMIGLLASSSAFDQIHEVYFNGVRFSAATLAELGRSPHWRELRRLTLDEELPSPSVLAALSDPAVFPNLEKLELSKLELREHDKAVDKQVDALAPALAALVASGRLRVLALRFERASAAVVEEILTAKTSSPLRVAVGRTHAISTKALERFAGLDSERSIQFEIEVPDQPELARLDRTGFLRKVAELTVESGDRGSRLIARSQNSSSLTHLRIAACNGGNTEMTPTTAKALATSTQLPRLRHLALTDDMELCQDPGIGARGLRALLASPLAAQLESLQIVEQSLGSEGVQALVHTDKLPALKRLTIAGEHLSSSQVRFLVHGSPLSATLEELSLAGRDEDGGVTLNEKAAEALVTAVDMPRLRVLDLSLNRLSPKTALRIRRATWAKRLEVLKTWDLQDTDDWGGSEWSRWSCAEETADP